MIEVQPISQRDTRWKLKRLGFGTGTIGSYGCTITALTMLLNSQGYDHTPDDVNDALKTAQAFAGDTKNLLWWARIKDAFPQTSMPTQYWDYDNAKVREILDSGRPVIVKVDGTPIGAPSHWVLYLGDGKMADPWYGDIASTSRYKPLRFVDIPVVKNSQSNMGDMTIGTELYEKLVKNATAKKDVANYLKTKKYSITSDPDDASAEEILGVVRGIETAVVTANNNASEWKTEVDNQKDKLANYKVQCQKDKSLLMAEQERLEKLVAAYKKKEGVYEAQRKEDQDALKEAQKQGGLKDIEITKLTGKVKSLQADSVMGMSSVELITIGLLKIFTRE